MALYRRAGLCGRCGDLGGHRVHSDGVVTNVRRQPPPRSVMRAAEAQNWRCCYCGARLELDTVTVDHVIPLALGGANRWANKVIACEGCNTDKGAALVNGVLSASLMARLSSAPTIDRIKFDALVLRRFALRAPLPNAETAEPWRRIVGALLDRLASGIATIEATRPRLGMPP